MKNLPERDNYRFDMSLPYKNIADPIKSLSIIGSPTPHRKVSLANNLPIKIRPARVAAGRGGFLPVNCRTGETFLEGAIL